VNIIIDVFNSTFTDVFLIFVTLLRFLSFFLILTPTFLYIYAF